MGLSEGATGICVASGVEQHAAINNKKLMHIDPDVIMYLPHASVF
jgi:hypothetical protein